MNRRAWLFIASMGCSYNSPTPNGNLSDGPLAPLEGGSTDCMAWTFMPAEAAPCSAPIPVDVLDLDGPFTLDSDSGMLVGVASTQLLPYLKIGTVGVVSVSALRVRSSATLRVIGSAPLAIFVWGDATITGTVDVSSSLVGGNGAGSNVGCVAENLGVAGTLNAGGGGGAFGADGGDGGDGKSGTGGNGGSARTRPLSIEGGCEGADAGVTGGTPGRKGSGGGGIALIAMRRLEVTGVVHAGGAGGTGGSQDESGGGGGGSGGMIKLEASDLAIQSLSILAANGGQGGGGAQGETAGVGVDGKASAVEAASANNEGGGSRGGGGGTVFRVTGNAAADSNKGGGGGGGGVGYVVYQGHATVVVGAATMSPAGQEL